MRTILAATVILVAVAWAAAGRSHSADAKPYGSPAPSSQSTPAALSSASCAAASCHGGGKPGQVGSEHSTFCTDLTSVASDPHAKAFAILFNDDSSRISRLLGRMVPAHKDAQCLKCHAVEGVEPRAALVEGVGCAACHGPSEKWVALHTQPVWKSLGNREKAETYGFIPGKSLVARTLNCARCHVGSDDREVNHDLIAAGHPRLAFEAARFHFNRSYRQHWVEQTPQPDFELRTWLIGQVVNVRAAVHLVRIRAADPERPWPELAGNSCYACHKPTEPRTSNRPRSEAPWETWSLATLKPTLEVMPRVFPGVTSPRLGSLAELRAEMARRNPNRASVSAKATATLAELDAWLAEVQAAEDRIGPTRAAPAGTADALLHALASDALDETGELRERDWDFLSTHYLGCAAAYHASGGSAVSPALTKPVYALDAALRFPPTRHGQRFDSPAGFDLTKLGEVRRQFQLIRTATSPLRGP